MPVKLMVWVLPATPLALSVMVTIVPLSVPAMEGVKVTLMMQLPPIPTKLLVEQVVPVDGILKSAG